MGLGSGSGKNLSRIPGQKVTGSRIQIRITVLCLHSRLNHNICDTSPGACGIWICWIPLHIICWSTTVSSKPIHKKEKTSNPDTEHEPKSETVLILFGKSEPPGPEMEILRHIYKLCFPFFELSCAFGFKGTKKC